MSALNPPIINVADSSSVPTQQCILNLNSLTFAEGITSTPFIITLAVNGFEYNQNGVITATSWLSLQEKISALSAIQSNANTFTGNLVSRSTLNISEKVNAVSISNGIALINYSLGGVFYVTPESNTNFNIPIPSKVLN